jgi:hypothetical protein
MVTGLIDAFKRMRRVRQILGFTGGGVYKRIDENRELLELLNEKAPALVADHPWLVGWFESQDEFLCELASAVPVVEAAFIPGDTNAPSTFPRPWPTQQSTG